MSRSRWALVAAFLLILSFGEFKPHLRPAQMLMPRSLAGQRDVAYLTKTFVSLKSLALDYPLSRSTILRHSLVICNLQGRTDQILRGQNCFNFRNHWTGRLVSN